MESYESYRNLIEDFLEEKEELLKKLDKLSESDLFRILSMVKNVTAKDGKLILEE